MGERNHNSIYPDQDDPAWQKILAEWEKSPEGQKERRKFEDAQKVAAMMPPDRIQRELMKIPLYRDENFTKRFPGVRTVVGYLTRVSTIRGEDEPSLFKKAPDARGYLDLMDAGDEETVTHYRRVKEALGTQ